MKKMKNLNVPRAVRRLYPNVTDVKDAKADVTIGVLPKDSADGKKKAAGGCAMARAVCRKFKAQGALIGLGTSYVIKGNAAIRFHTPDAVAREIISFDRHQDFEPGNYQLKKISPARRLGERNQNRTSNERGPNQTAKTRRHVTGGVRMLNVNGGTSD